MWETCSEGSYISGERHGLWTTIYGDRSLQEGLVEQGTYKNGIKHGAWESKYSVTGTFMKHTVEAMTGPGRSASPVRNGRGTGSRPDGGSVLTWILQWAV
jgi:hypothetical protein